MSLHDEAPPISVGATAPLGLGEVLAGKYRLERLIGAGGMGLVLLARHIELDQPVAIKLMREEALHDADARARFAREAKAVVRLKSEHVARVTDVGTLENGAPYLVMEYLQGSDLGTVLAESGDNLFAVEEAVAYVLQVCEAVAEAHGAGIVHRDLKPRNVFVTTGVDGKPLLKVLDFGISKLLHLDGATVDMALTKTKDIMGSPSYMAPEQLRAARDVDERADIWSLGVMLYEIITGHLPWEADSITELGAMVLRDPLRPMRVLREGVPRELDDVVARCLEKERAHRFASVEELAHALEPHARGLAAGSGARITSVARTSRNPPPARRPSIGERTSSSGRVLVSGGTSVSWGETELVVPKPSVAPPRLQSRSVVLIAAGIAALALAAGAGVLVSRHTTAVSSTSPLPEDRGAVRPPVSATTALTTPPPVTSATDEARPEAAAIPTNATSVAPPTLASIPRRAPPPSSVAPSVLVRAGTATATATAAAAATDKTAPAAAPKATDAHDMGSIPRK